MPTPRTRFKLPAIAAAATVALLLAGCSTNPAPPSGTEVQNPPSESASSSSATSSSSPATSSSSPAAPPTKASSLLKEQGVSAAHPAAVDAGMGILEDGGNAVDAAVATAFAVAVVEPFASGIGGGGSAVLAEHGSEPLAYDYREVVAQDGVIPESGTGIPGFVAGLAQIHGEHGNLEWAELLAPAIDVAENGFPISGFLAQRMESDAGPSTLRGLSQFRAWGGMRLRGEGDELVQKDLAQTMRVLAEEGPDAFYTGSLVKDLTRVDGIDPASLAAYKPEKPEPVRGQFGDHELVSVAPALPGAALIQMLQVAEELDVAEAAPGSSEYVSRLARAWTVADDSVTRDFGDPRFVDVPVDRITDPETNAELAREQATAGTAHEGRPSAAREIVPGNTTHLTVVDSDGFTVSMTNTITNFWGGGKTDSVGGFFMNNQLSRFASLDTPNNQAAPGRKSVSWAAPSLVLDGQGRAVLGLGSPGGHQIPNILAGVLVPWALQDASLQESIKAPRSHLQDGVIALERPPGDELAGFIESQGWETKVTSREDAVFGSVQAVEIDYATGTLNGAADSRREGSFDKARP